MVAVFYLKQIAHQMELAIVTYYVMSIMIAVQTSRTLNAIQVSSCVHLHIRDGRL